MSRVTITGADPASVMHVCHNLRPADREEILATRWSDNVLDLAEDTMRVSGVKFVAHLEGVGPVAVYGGCLMWPGVASMWAFGTPYFRQIGGRLSRHIQRVMVPTLAINGVHRAEARSLSTHTEAHKWLEWLGAEREATLKGFGKNGEDFFVYAWSINPNHVCIQRRRG